MRESKRMKMNARATSWVTQQLATLFLSGEMYRNTVVGVNELNSDMMCLIFLVSLPCT